MKILRSLCVSSAIFFLNSGALAVGACGTSWLDSRGRIGCEMVSVSATIDYPFSRVSKPGHYLIQNKVRAGIFSENTAVNFQGNILYFQGLGDSIVNHRPLFEKLSNAGYRVVAFDYFGQGGSEGSMNDTRIWDIPKIGMEIYQKFARREGAWETPTILGWSTGGLAAYLAAHLGLSKEIVLLAPGIVPKTLIGEQDPLKLKFNQITLGSLTTETYGVGILNPHIDPIRPGSPLEVKDFALNLLHVSFISRSWKIPSAVRGLVLLSGDGDTYVDAAKTKRVVRKNAPHFSVVQYQTAYHEIDNESQSIRTAAHSKILEFLKREKISF